MQSTRSFSRTTIILHWLVALLVVFQLIGGLAMVGKIYSFYPIHKSMGIIAFLIIIARIAWRFKKGWPEPVGTHQRYELALAKFTHWLLLCCTLAQPLSGMLASGASGHGFGIFNIVTIIPANIVDTHSLDTLGYRMPGDVVPYSEYWMNIGYALHSWVGYTMIVAIVLHVTGALKHHLFDRDATLKRMVGRA